MKHFFTHFLILGTLFLLISGVLLISGCAQPAPDSGFIKTPELLKEDSKIPFDAVWFKEGVDLRTYKKVYVAPVDTTHLLKMDWWEKFDAATKLEKPEDEAQILAKYWQNEVVQAFKNDKDDDYTVVEQPDKETLIIELALVEVVPTKVWLNIIGYLAIGALDTGETAVEGRFKDGATSEPIFSFKDKRMGKMAIVSIADLQWYSHAKHTLTEWASDLVDVCDKSPDETLSRRIPITLKPW